MSQTLQTVPVGHYRLKHAVKSEVLKIVTLRSTAITLGVTIVAAHAATIAAVALWYTRQPVEPNILPAIAVTLAPQEASSPTLQDQDIAVVPTMQQAEAGPEEPPKVEEKPVEQVVQSPSPPQQVRRSGRCLPAKPGCAPACRFRPSKLPLPAAICAPRRSRPALAP